MKYPKYKKCHVSQTFECFDLFKKFLKVFDIVIEIGTYSGGFTYFISENTDAKVYTFDIVHPDKRNANGDLSIIDIFCTNNITFIEDNAFNKIDFIKNIIKNKKTLLLCDGGDKNAEINTFCSILSEGDVIMCHDYDDGDFEKIKKNIGWPLGAESNYNNIKVALEENNFKKFKLYNELKNNFWGSFIRH